jgi:hypothetical protein
MVSVANDYTFRIAAGFDPRSNFLVPAGTQLQEIDMSFLSGLIGGAGGASGILGMLGGGNLASMLGEFASKMFSNILQGAVEQFAKQTGMSDFSKDAAQLEIAKAFGDKDGIAQNRKEMLGDILKDFQKATNASDTDMGHIDRDIKNLQEKLQKMLQEMSLENAESGNSKSSKKKAHSSGGGASAGGAEGGGGAAGAGGAGQSGGAGGTEEAGGTKGTDGTGSKEDVKSGDGDDDWFIIVAKSLAKAAQRQAEVVKQKAQELSAATDKAADNPDDKKAAAEVSKLQVESTAESQKMGYLMQGIMTALNALADSLKTAARSQ